MKLDHGTIASIFAVSLICVDSPGSRVLLDGLVCCAEDKDIPSCASARMMRRRERQQCPSGRKVFVGFFGSNRARVYYPECRLLLRIRGVRVLKLRVLFCSLTATTCCSRSFDVSFE